MPSLSILGAGFSGLTTGVVLNLLGYPTTIYAARTADHSSLTAHHPPFASLYPAASVIPHLVQVEDLSEHLRLTHAFFGLLRDAGHFGVRQQPHAEVSEAPRPVPAYAPQMPGYAPLPEDGSGHPDAPRRAAADALYGWRFDAFFAEGQRYRPALYDLYRATGGTIRKQRVTRERLGDVPGDVLVNCTGLGTLELFDDPAPISVIQGCLVHVTPPAKIDPPRSYNYTPGPDIYATADGDPADVYFYPRSDVWILGGSRRVGTWRHGAWSGPPLDGPTVDLGGQAVPEPVLSVNRELIADLTGADIADQPMRATFGYRFARDLEGEGVRLDISDEAGRPVAHNYGHGGAGVTLSWSCAVMVARRLHAHDLLRERHQQPVELPSKRASFFAELQQLAAREVLEHEAA